MIRVDFSDPRWVRAAQKAVAFGVEPTLRETKPMGRVYVVPSHTNDEEYIVTIHIDRDGRSSLSCTCPAGSHDRPCWHAALVWLTWSREAVVS